MIDGYRLRAMGDKTALCPDCADAISLKKSKAEEISGQIAGETCVICTDRIGRDKNPVTNYPDQISTLLYAQFEDVGGRFNGVIPRVDSEMDTDTDGAGTFAKAIGSPHDPVVVSLTETEGDVYVLLQDFAETVQTRGPIRGSFEKFTTDEGDVLGYEAVFYAVQ